MIVKVSWFYWCDPCLEPARWWQLLDGDSQNAPLEASVSDCTEPWSIFSLQSISFQVVIKFSVVKQTVTFLKVLSHKKSTRCSSLTGYSLDSQVSLDSRVRETINRNMLEPTSHTFDDAQLQIYTLMQRDSYPRYMNSPAYKNLLNTLSEQSPES